MKNKVIICLFLILSLAIVDYKVKASEIVFDKSIGYSSFDEYKENLCRTSYEYDEIIFREINVGKNKINLYCEFASQEKALANFKIKFSNTLNYIMNRYNLEEISGKNWEEYKNIIQQENENDKKRSYDYIDMEIFFETYENTKDNLAIENEINELTNSNYDDEYLDEALAMLIPSYYILEGSRSKGIDLYATQIFNVSKGITYAKKYAWNSNKDKYGDLGSDGDCANFASQILHEGGYNTVFGVTSLFGWWYTKTNNTFDYAHNWTSATKFVNYWGKKKVYKSRDGFTQFSKDVQTGDFIALDKNNDGNFDHLGFVTDVKSKTELKTEMYNDEKNGICYYAYYYDFTVAQHTTNYERKVSSDANNWDQGAAKGYDFAIININKN